MTAADANGTAEATKKERERERERERSRWPSSRETIKPVARKTYARMRQCIKKLRP